MLGVATGKLDAHFATGDHAYGELLRFFRGSRPVPTLFLLDAELTLAGDGVEVGAAAQPKVEAALRALRAGLD